MILRLELLNYEHRIHLFTVPKQYMSTENPSPERTTLFEAILLLNWTGNSLPSIELFYLFLITLGDLILLYYFLHTSAPLFFVGILYAFLGISADLCIFDEIMEKCMSEFYKFGMFNTRRTGIPFEFPILESEFQRALFTKPFSCMSWGWPASTMAHLTRTILERFQKRFGAKVGVKVHPTIILLLEPFFCDCWIHCHLLWLSSKNSCLKDLQCYAIYHILLATWTRDNPKSEKTKEKTMPQVVVQEVVTGWKLRLESVKRKIRLADQMIRHEQEPMNRSYWQDYKRTMMRRFHTLVKTHDYIANWITWARPKTSPIFLMT